MAHATALRHGGVAVPALTALAMLCASPVAVDGDTLRCADIGLVRLLHIDAPEMPGHCRPGRRCVPGDGREAQRVLAGLIARRRVVCSAEGRDAYGRVLALCTAGGADLSCAMVARGQAVERYGRLSCPRRR